MRYDAAIIGAGADGLTAAATLATAGLKVVVLERAACAGGRLATLEFHPGHFASPFADAVTEVPPAIARALNLKLRHGPPLPEPLRTDHHGALARAFSDAVERAPAGALARWLASPAASWPGENLATAELASWPALCDAAMAGRALDPELSGSALSLLSLPRAEALSGGLGALGEDFAQAAESAGAEIRLGCEAVEVVIAGARAAGVALADGERVMADAVISTLDLKRSLLSLFAWSALPPHMLQEARNWRMAGARARLLLALKRPLRRDGPVILRGDGHARAAFRRGAVPQMPTLLLDPVSRRDAGLAPPGAATATVTLSDIPYRLVDGGWTGEKRTALAARALMRIEKALPGTLAAILAVRILTPPDMETMLGATGGDLDGGALAPDQMLSLRPGPRTRLPGFYLGGRSTQAGPLGTGAAGFAAAAALMAEDAG
ncbi:MAG TPA: FAD-dependent oxidoreductase [Rhizomicrobium sp.]|nr:FAD-dependent oxidoreductase [Rhizomicrobium sp.]